MPQLQPLVLTDRKATPVNHTFNPQNIVSGVARVAESSGIPLGDNAVTISIARNGNGRYKAHLKFTFPVLQTETVNGVSKPVIVRSSFAEVHFNFDQSSSEAERNDVVGMVQSALLPAKALVHDAVVKLEGIY